MRINRKRYLFIIGILFISECTSNKPLNTSSPVNNSSLGPPTVIYKTRKDYYDKVPVTLSDDKTKIVSYPGPGDVYYNGKLALPTRLDSGYLLDNRGINKNVAFLNITYEEYSKLKDGLPMDEMMKRIIDNNPLTVMYSCGSRYKYKDIATDLNRYIDSNKLYKFKRIL